MTNKLLAVDRSLRGVDINRYRVRLQTRGRKGARYAHDAVLNNVSLQQSLFNKSTRVVGGNLLLMNHETANPWVKGASRLD